MKRRICTMAAALALVLTMTAGAVELRAIPPTPSLSFDGTTANCEIDIWGDSSSDRISVTVELWHGSTRLETWTQSGTHYLFFSEEYSNGIEAGERYTMVVNYTVAGRSYGPLEASATCRG